MRILPPLTTALLFLCVLLPHAKAQAHLQEAATEETATGETPLAERLREIHFPRLCIDAMPLAQALETLASMAEAQGRPVNLIRLSPKGGDPLVTLSLRNISLERALFYMARSVGYSCELEEDAVVLRPASEPGTLLKTEFFPVSRSALVRMAGLEGVKYRSGDSSKDAREDEAPTQIEVEASLRAFLERAGVPFDAVPGATLALGAGQLIVTNSGTNLEKVRAIMDLYRELKQVRIEARFMEVSQSDLDEFGIEWGLSNASSTTKSNAATYELGSTNRTLSSALSGTTTSEQIVITGLDESVGTSGTLTQTISAPTLAGAIDLATDASPVAQISGILGTFDIETVVNALSRKSSTNLMSAPSLTVLSGERAEITVAQEMIYPRSFGDVDSNVSRGSSSTTGAAVSITAGTPKDFATRNVGVEMNVMATVENDGSISMSLEPCVTEFEGFVEYGGPSIAVAGETTVSVPSGFYQPVFNVRRIRTEVTIRDGATIVMGGLTREESVTVKDKIPLLGDIPYLGRFFRNEGETTQKKDLLIFVTARTIGPDGEAMEP